jgi:hypothetical protein
MTDRFKWEFFSDSAYWDMCAVRPVGDKDFKSQNLFHVSNLKEGERLSDLLNAFTAEAEQLRKERDESCLGKTDKEKRDKAIVSLQAPAPRAVEDFTPSEQILIDALKFYATKEHWMSNTENGQPFTLCALKHGLDYAGWVHAHGQLQRWAVVKYGEKTTPTPPNAALDAGSEEGKL